MQYTMHYVVFTHSIVTSLSESSLSRGDMRCGLASSYRLWLKTADKIDSFNAGIYRDSARTQTYNNTTCLEAKTKTIYIQRDK